MFPYFTSRLSWETADIVQSDLEELSRATQFKVVYSNVKHEQRNTNLT